MNNRCPYCNTLFSMDGIDCDYSFPKFEKFYPYRNAPPKVSNPKSYGIVSHYCPECLKPIMWLYEVKIETSLQTADMIEPDKYELLYPKFKNVLLSSPVPEPYASDYKEASLTLEISAKASAALSRRCLQNIIQNELGIKKRNLEEEIRTIIEQKTLPKFINDDLDAIRTIGNFAAHPKKSETTGEIIDVEDGEAEWLLGTLENLLIYLFETVKKGDERRKMFEEKYKKK